MNFILFTHIARNLLLRDPTLAHLKSLASADLPGCPCCGSNMVKSGNRTIKSPETDCLGQDYFQTVELTKLKCSSRNCPMKLEYLSSSYQHSKVFYKTAAQLVEILGLAPASSLIGVEQPVLKAAFNVFKPRQITINIHSVNAFHLMKINSRYCLLVIDLAERKIVDIASARSIVKLVSSMMGTMKKLDRFIVPNLREVIEHLDSNQISANYEVERIGTEKFNEHSFTSEQNMTIIKEAEVHALKFLTLSGASRYVGRNLKREILGFF
jgi:hypothetical protein